MSEQRGRMPRRWATGSGWRALLADVTGDTSAPEATPLLANLVQRLDDRDPWPDDDLDRAWAQAQLVTQGGGEDPPRIIEVDPPRPWRREV